MVTLPWSYHKHSDQRTIPTLVCTSNPKKKFAKRYAPCPWQEELTKEYPEIEILDIVLEEVEYHEGEQQGCDPGLTNKPSSRLPRSHGHSGLLSALARITSTSTDSLHIQSGLRVARVLTDLLVRDWTRNCFVGARNSRALLQIRLDSLRDSRILRLWTVADN